MCIYKITDNSYFEKNTLKILLMIIKYMEMKTFKKLLLYIYTFYYTPLEQNLFQFENKASVLPFTIAHHSHSTEFSLIFSFFHTDEENLPVICSPYKKTVIFIASSFIQHASVNHSTHWHIHIIAGQLLHIFYNLISC